MNPYLRAIFEEHPKRLNALLSNERPNIYLMHVAASLDSIPVVKTLADYYVIDERDSNGNTPLHFCNSVEMARWLVENGSDVSVKNNAGLYPYQMAADEETAQYLKEQFEKDQETEMFAFERGSIYETKMPWDERIHSEVIGMDDLEIDQDENNRYTAKFEGQTYKISDRFLSSFASKMKLSNNVYNVFSLNEVLDKGKSKEKHKRFKVTIDEEEKTFLGVVGENEKILPAATACTIFTNDPRLVTLDYDNGVIKAKFYQNKEFIVKNDSPYIEQLYLQYQIDGYGTPCIYLGLVRQVCTNGMVAMISNFKTDILISDKTGIHLERLLKSYNNDNGYEVLESRIKKAQQTQASLNEVYKINNLLAKYVNDTQEKTKIIECFDEISGDPCNKYRITSIANVSAKRRTLLPVDCSVGDLINFCSELTTHYNNYVAISDTFNKEIGSLLAKEYDLENLYTVKKNSTNYYLKNVLQ